MRRWVFGSCVLVTTASATLAIAWQAMSPAAPVAIDCPRPPIPPPQVKRLLYVDTGNSTLPSALATEYAVTVRSPAEMPTQLARYDRIVVSDVPVHLLDADHVAALDAYVR